MMAATGAATGGCLCGAVRFTCEGELGPAGYCHCEDCRRCTGSAFNLSVRCPRDAFRLEQGDLGGYTKAGASGQPLTRHFCRACGSPIYTSSPRHADAVYLKAGVFDDPAVAIPAFEAWTRSRTPWSVIPIDIAHYEQGRI